MSVKTEFFAGDLESSIIEALKQQPKGVTQKMLEEMIPSLSVLELVQVLNKFISQDKISLLKKGKQLVYAWKEAGTGKQFQGGDVEEKLVFEAVKRAGNDGITPKDIKFACNLPQPQVTKILKSLEAKKMVKTVISSAKKKLFMLFNLEPSQNVTGGTFYSGQEFEAEFVDVLSDQCYRYLLQAKATSEKLLDVVSQRRAAFKSSSDVCNYINSLQISKVSLKRDDIEKILVSLVFDGKLEKNLTLNASGEAFYRVVKPLIDSAALMRMPCGVCPVYHECGVGRDVNPANCAYLKDWLEL